MEYINEFFKALWLKLGEAVAIGNISEEMIKAISPKTVFSFTIGDYFIRITDATLVSWIVMVIIFGLAFWMGHKPQRLPTTKRQLIAESLVNLLLKLCQSSNMTYEQAEQVAPYVGTLAIFIGMTNLASLFKIAPPAKNPAFPIALAVFNICYVIVVSIKFAGLKGFWRSLTYPTAILLPFKILDYLIKPVSLSLRLYGNIFGAFILMEFINIIVPAIIPGLVGLWFDLADGILQGVIFTYLSVLYIGEVIEGAHDSNVARMAKIEARSAQSAN